MKPESVAHIADFLPLRLPGPEPLFRRPSGSGPFPSHAMRRESRLTGSGIVSGIEPHISAPSSLCLPASIIGCRGPLHTLRSAQPASAIQSYPPSVAERRGRDGGVLSGSASPATTPVQRYVVQTSSVSSMIPPAIASAVPLCSRSTFGDRRSRCRPKGRAAGGEHEVVAVNYGESILQNGLIDGTDIVFHLQVSA